MAQPYRKGDATVMRLSKEDRELLEEIADNLEQISVNLEQIWSKM